MLGKAYRCQGLAGFSGRSAQAKAGIQECLLSFLDRLETARAPNLGEKRSETDRTKERRAHTEPIA